MFLGFSIKPTKKEPHPHVYFCSVIKLPSSTLPLNSFSGGDKSSETLGALSVHSISETLPSLSQTTQSLTELDFCVNRPGIWYVLDDV
jgi:hypothetical protein